MFGNRRICGRSRFPAAESSVCVLRAFAITVSTGEHANYFQKEDTRYKALSYLRYGIRFNPEIVKLLRRVVARKAFYIILRNPNGNRNVLYLYRNDDGSWNWNYNWLDNDWNDRNFTAVSQQLSSFSLLIWESFVLISVRTTHQAFFQLRLFLQIAQCIFYYP